MAHRGVELMCETAIMADRVCLIDGCDIGVRLTRGMCPKHYRYWLDHTAKSDRPPVPRPAFQDFVAKSHEHGCWLWTGKRDRAGYGRWSRVLAHRQAWLLANGPIPEGMFICHSCDNPPCVNPAHLYPGTHQQNMQDKVDRGRVFHPPLKTHCSGGHEYTDENTVVRSGKRVCRICERARRSAAAERSRRRRGIPRVKLDDTDRSTIRDLRRAGHSYRAISKQTGRAYDTVFQVVKAAGL